MDRDLSILKYICIKCVTNAITTTLLLFTLNHKDILTFEVLTPKMIQHWSAPFVLKVQIPLFYSLILIGYVKLALVNVLTVCMLFSYVGCMAFGQILWTSFQRLFLFQYLFRFVHMLGVNPVLKYDTIKYRLTFQCTISTFGSGTHIMKTIELH